MRRIALVAPAGSLRDVLVAVADAGTVEIDRGEDGDKPGEAARRLQHAGQAPTEPALSADSPDLDWLERAGRYDLLAGEAQLESYAAAAVRRSGAAALAGWIPADRLPDVAARLAGAGGAVVPLPRPRGVEVPTLLGGRALRRSLTPLVQTYGTVPYADIDPTWLAWATYVLMFGMMFGDAGQGVLLVGVAAALRAGWPRWARRFRQAWPFVGGAGLAATAFGLLYGEFFGPTGLVPTIWLNPLSQPVTLLLVAVGIGAVLLAGAYALGTINRWREGGWPAALYAPSGIAGASLFLGAGLAIAGWYFHQTPVLVAGGLAALAGLLLALAGFLANAGGGGAGIIQAVIELVDMLIRLGSNVVSFARLAAFGLTHAALGLLVWEGTRALWQRGGALTAAAVAVFLAGTALAFSLEALVAAIQALRLEYYELFSRVFVAQGRLFRPWHLRTVTGHGTCVQEKLPSSA
ncbi:MAG TPA: V-type ATPase 116kDa subunit family protein [Streptosporangiaceae bacterium]|nr:V-type ATPase 116kDa subunit family protein [Streptosporangiaceae bacterium]